MVLLLVGTSTIGCKDEEKASTEESIAPGSAAAELKEAKTATKGAVQAMQDYVYAEKTEFIQATTQELIEILEQINELEAAILVPGRAVRADAESKLKAARQKWADAKAKAAEAETATETTWQDVQKGYQSARQDLKDSIDATRQWVSDTAKP